MNTSLRSISQSQTNNKCVRHYQKSFWGWLFFFQDSVYGFAAQVKAILQRTEQNLKRRKLMRFNSLIRLHQLHAQDLVVKITTKAKVFIQTRKVTGRLIAGVFLAGCLAPLSDIFYAFDFLKQFEQWNYDTESKWFYDNYANFFLCIGPYMGWFFFTMGVYFLFIPGTDKRRFILIPFCSYPVVKILWLIQVTTDPEYYSIPPFAYWTYGVMVSSLLWLTSDYLVYLFNHKVLNAISTLSNITNNRKNLPAEQVIEMYATTANKIKTSI